MPDLDEANPQYTENGQMMESSSPLISVVIPTRLRPELVVRAVQSALNQTYSNVEVVVVVDGSDPATVRVLEKFSGAKVRIVALSENVGGSEARNVGVREAIGTWIALLDDDDEWFPEKLEKQMAMVENLSAPHCLITCRRLERQAGKPDVLAPRRIPRAGEDVSEYMFYSEDGRRHTCGPQTSSYLGTKRLFLDVPFSSGLKCHQDWDWYLRATRSSAMVIAMVDEPLYIMYVEETRLRVTHLAQWRRSLDWVESRKDLFTPRAYTSFLIYECMFRCEEKVGRAKNFGELLLLCWNSGGIRTRDLLAVVKWYLFRPGVRQRLTRYSRQLRARLMGSDASVYSVENLETQRGVHG